MRPANRYENINVSVGLEKVENPCHRYTAAFLESWYFVFSRIATFFVCINSSKTEKKKCYN